MNIDRARIINDFIEPNKRQYIIPVYQRNYEWSREQCEKLFEDIIQAYKMDKQHFCGSIVFMPFTAEHNIQYFVIVDGQQRLTTIYILLKALIDCAESDRERDSLKEVIFNRDRYDTYDIDTANKLKLKPIKSDNVQLTLLMNGKRDEMDNASGIWINYDIFREMIKQTIEEDSSLSVKNIFRGVENLTCASIRLEETDNAQEIFERINSTGVPLSLADQIRNYVLMTDVEQERLYEEYWLHIEELVPKNHLNDFFIDYLNLTYDGFITEKKAYNSFKKHYNACGHTNESMLRELVQYAEIYHTFIYGSNKLSAKANRCLEGLRKLNQTTVHLFLFKVFFDYQGGFVSDEDVENILQMLLSYSIRRIMCEIPSSSLRGFYKTLYNRVFIRKENKEHYYDAVISFILQTTTRDGMPSDNDFLYALKNNNLYGKHALCRYILVSVENSGKEKIETDNLTVEHIMPKGSNLSLSWQKMLGNNWKEDRDRWVHTIGNLTLTGYNSELGDRPFLEKKRLIEEKKTKVTILYCDVQDKDRWNASMIQQRAERLSEIVFDMFDYAKPEVNISFSDPRYKEYTCEDPDEATHKLPNYYELLGERTMVSRFSNMARSVARKLYDLDNSIIEQMAAQTESLPGFQVPAFSYDKKDLRLPVRIPDTDIYMFSCFTANDYVKCIKELLKRYDFDIANEFVYSAMANEKDSDE